MWKHQAAKQLKHTRLLGFEPLEERRLLSVSASALNGAALPYLGWNYVSFTSGELPVTTSWVEQDYAGSQGLSGLHVASVASPGGEGVLRTFADMVRPATVPGDNTDGEIFVDLRYRLAHPEEDSTRPVACGPMLRDLTDARITVDFRLDASLYGPGDAPNGTQIFLKSVEEHVGAEDDWWGYYGTWYNAQPGWQTMDLDLSTDTPAYVDPNFDASKIALLGIKLGTNEQSVGQWDGWMDVANVSIEYADGTVSEYAFENTDDAITRMAQTGANTVALVDHWFVDRRSLPGTPLEIDTEIHPDALITQQYPGGPTTAIEETIERLHAEGLTVHLKPHLDLAGFAYEDGEWRGPLRPSDEEMGDFFESYSEFIGFYAEIAERTGAEGLVVETELVSLDTDPTLRGHWEDIVDSLRAIYSGDLIVAANWDSYQDHTFVDLVDVVGIDAYFPLTDAPDPTMEELKAAWRNSQAPDYVGRDWVAEIAEWSATLGKPFYFTEIGIQSRDGAAVAPGSSCEGGTAQFNAGLQVAYYEATLDVFFENEGFAGLLGWNWLPWSDAGGVGDIDFMPQNKELEAEAPRLFGPVHLEDGTLYARGTFDDDVFELSGTGLSIGLVLNGQLHLFLKEFVESVRLLGLSGDDSVIFHGDTTAEWAKLWPGRAQVNGVGYTAVATSVETVTVNGNGGDDVAQLYDSAGPDTFNAGPDLATLSGPGFTHTVNGFPHVHSYASDEGQTDTATLHGFSGQQDTFKGYADQSKAYGIGFFTRAKGFDVVSLNGAKADGDVALVYDSDEADTFEAWPDLAQMA
ncbi:MAG: hypothetical protein HQ582_01070, partial [Planctomycetes bacterium]|nr:hypothetical protein [Planctomycetota bacterium]